MRRALAASAAALLSLAALTACGGSATDRAEDAMNDALSGSASVQLDEDGGVKVEGSDGTIEFGTGGLPASWPSEVPPPAGFEVIMAGSTAGDTNWTGSFTAPGDQMAAVEAYAKDLMNKGFAVDGNIPLGANGMYGLVGNGYRVDFLAIYMGDSTQVTMRIEPLP
jgi:ABC-type amino acid transport substrate-binding protein